MKLIEHYNQNVVPKIMAEFGWKNKYQVPRITTVIINVGIGKIREDAKMVETIQETLKNITGQRPVFRLATKAIAGFKVKKKDKAGLLVTLRGPRMGDFIEKLISITLPRVRDFRGLKESAIDKMGNLNIGFREQIVFPEIKYDRVEKTHGLQVCLTTNIKNRPACKLLYQLLGFPFQK